MSTLKVNAISNVAGTGSPNITEQAKAWVNFNGDGTVAIRADYNVTSITDNGTGLYTVNFTNAMADLNYTTVGSSWYSGVTASLFAIAAPPTSTSSKQISTQNAASTASVDVDHCCIHFFR
jgi:hypothetical protein